MNNFIVVPDDNSILSEAFEAFSQLTPEAQQELISLLQFLALLEE
jgi:hypothetical protein